LFQLGLHLASRELREGEKERVVMGVFCTKKTQFFLSEQFIIVNITA